MKRCLVILLFTCFSAGCDVSDFIKKKKGTEKKEAAKIPDGVRENYRDDRLVSTVTYKDGLKNGPAKNFYPDGKVHSEFIYKDDVKHGEFKWYYDNGQLYQHAFYKDGEKDSIETSYFKNGKIRSVAPWKNGMPGAGLVEYTNTGKKRTFPKIQFTEIDEIKLNDQFTVMISLEGARKKVDFYQEELVDGQYLPSFYQPMIAVKKGRAELHFEVLPGTYFMRDINIIAHMKTPYKNNYIVQRKYHLAIENRGN